MARSKIFLNIEGAEEVFKALEVLDYDIRANIAQKALEAACKPIVKAAKAHAPRDTGMLRTSIGAIVRRYRNGSILTAVIGPRTNFRSKKHKALLARGIRKTPALYAHLVEYGTRPRTYDQEVEVKAKDGSIHRYKRRRHHPGSKANPFLRPAFDAGKSHVLPALKAELEKRIAARMRWGGTRRGRR